MAFELMKVLLEDVSLFEQGGLEMQAPSKEALLNNKTFLAIQKQAPKFAEQLANAWMGDLQEFGRTRGASQDYLFPRMATEASLKRMYPQAQVGPAWGEGLKQLQALFQQTFPKLSGHADTGVWSQERWAKESAEFDAEAYELLREWLDAGDAELLSEDKE